MAEQHETCLPTAAWFLNSEDGDPLGTVYRSGDSANPNVGDRITLRDSGKEAEVVSFTELRATCAIRRFRVVVRIMD